MYFFIINIFIAVFASIGVICILKEIYGIIISSFEDESIVIIFSANNSKNEFLFRKILYIKQKYFRNMHIIFVDENNNKSSIMKEMALKHQMLYINGKD